MSLLLVVLWRKTKFSSVTMKSVIPTLMSQTLLLVCSVAEDDILREVTSEMLYTLTRQWTGLFATCNARFSVECWWWQCSWSIEKLMTKYPSVLHGRSREQVKARVSWKPLCVVKNVDIIDLRGVQCGYIVTYEVLRTLYAYVVSARNGYFLGPEILSRKVFVL